MSRPTYSDKFVRDNVVAPSVLLQVVIVTLPSGSGLAAASILSWCVCVCACVRVCVCSAEGGVSRALCNGCCVRAEYGLVPRLGKLCLLQN